MVKGVNRNIIEIRDTGSEIFERIVFYISPKYNYDNAKSMKTATDEFKRIISNEPETGMSLRHIVKNKKRKKLILLFAGSFSLLVSLGLLMYFILK